MRLLLSCILVIWICYLLPSCGQDNPSTATQKENNSTSGQSIYKKLCTTCHGADGTLGLNESKDLSKSDIPYQEVVQVVTKGRNMMAAYGEILTPEEITMVSKYVMKLRK